jgi:hypothetical protein
MPAPPGTSCANISALKDLTAWGAEAGSTGSRQLPVAVITPKLAVTTASRALAAGSRVVTFGPVRESAPVIT